tara:strand:+ start:2678 stop:5554 length:2877 start_codon:yes stop_codon:yes gene_type:complete
MNKKNQMKLKTLSFLLLFSTILFSQDNDNILTPTLIEKCGTNDIDIKYQKWVLPNGLTVLIHEDNSDPIVQVHVTYHVGSNRESAGKSGFAHFFEHMMFQGSENVEDEKHFKIINDAGGDMNGNTTYDRTVYYQTIPSNYLETALWLESDRMGFLLDAVSNEKFENQRDAVKNEKYQNQISQPYGLSYEILGQNLYPADHPYNWPVIGYVDDLDRAELNDLRNFFLRWYGPNNAILTIAGDVNTPEVIKLVNKYFGGIKTGPVVRELRPNIPRLKQNIYCGYTDNIYLPMTQIVFPTVPNYHKDEAPLDILSSLMGEGKSSIFYKNFVENEKAIQIAVQHPCRELSGEFQFIVLSYPDWQEDQDIYFNNIEQEIRNTINDWENKGFTDDELKKVKMSMESDIINRKISLSSKVNSMSSWEWLGDGNYNISSEIKRYNDVTREDVLRVYNKYIKNRKSVIMNVKPKSPFSSEELVLESFNPNSDMITSDDPQYMNLEYNKSSNEYDICCRSDQPIVKSPKAPKIPEYYTYNFNNGIKLIGTEYSEMPKVFMQIKINGGNLLENSKKLGLSAITAELMNESTENFSAEEMQDLLSQLGSEISFVSEGSSTIINISCLTKNINETIELLEEKLFHPGFNENELKRVKKQFIEGLNSQEKSADYIAQNRFKNILFGNTPLGSSPSEKTIKKIKLKDVKSFYNNFYSPDKCNITIVGDILEKEIISELSFLNNWKSNDFSIQNDFTFPEDKKTEIYLIDKPGAAQSVIFMGHKSHKYDVDGEYFKSRVMNYPLGSGASARLFLNLREDKGYTYGVYSFFSGSKESGYFGVYSSVRTDATDSALVEILYELENYRNNGISNDELISTKNSMLNADALKYESPIQKIRFLNRILEYNLDKTYIKSQSNILNSITKEEIDKISNKYINFNNLQIVIVGNSYLIKKKLENLTSKNGNKYNYNIKEIK